MADFADFDMAQGIATAISVTGAPTLVFKRVIDALIGQNIPAASTLTRPAAGTYPVAQPGYEIVINVATLGGTAPACSVELQWYDSTFGQLIADEVYYFLSGDINGHFIHGSGPTQGDSVVVVVRNWDAASAVTFTYTLLQTSRTYTRSFWRTITKGGVNPVFPGFTATPQNLPAGVLCAQSVSVPGAGNAQFMLPLYTGTVRLDATGTATAGQQTWGLINVTEQVAPVQRIMAGSNGQTGYAPNGAASLYLPEIALPRAQCELTLLNGNAVAQFMDTNIIAQESTS